ncbi:type VI secretion system Vgr family protein [Desulfoluna spongiiphila]|uniref:type VI secretion system Vgr family protein n=1 Tax=Desulfoluna spongiiphila TaxID=419481 RepID=UPI001254DF15|nr:type VI secretion system tip protein TssI/VgrG [Desulfoluna spongiiphila]VVS91538.1 phage late control gene d protein (gpd) [Desulfoluna spongiiphila]
MISPVEIFENMRQFDCTLNGTKLDVYTLSAAESVSDHFSVQATVVSEKRRMSTDFTGQEGLFTLIGRKQERYVHGVVSRFEEQEKRGRFYLYGVTLVPRAWEQTLISDVRIFQEKTVPEIVSEVLQDGGMQSNTFEFRTHRTYSPREYCVQYRETNWAFVARLLAEEGIFYYYEFTEADHVLVFGDTPACHKPISDKAEVLFTPPGQLVDQMEYVNEFRVAENVVSGKHVLKDYAFKTPSYRPSAEKPAESYENLELYDYPGLLTDEATGTRLAAVGLERARLQKDEYAGKSLCRSFAVGHLFTLAHYPYDESNREYLLTRITHRGTQPQSLQELAPNGKGNTYANEFSCIPSEVPFRPDSIAKPAVSGVQTAVVTGPEGKEIYTDTYGRIKVQYHWDRLGNRDAKSSCWMRVAQSVSGPGWGAVFIPRIGQEVIVSFIDGDPDRPIVTGAVYNGANMPPYPLPAEKTKSTIKTRSTPNGNGFNELRFEDLKGEEEIYIHGEKDWNIEIKNDKGQHVGHDETLAVDNDRRKTVGNDQQESIGNNKDITVAKNHTESVGENMAVTVGKNLDESTGENKAVTVGKNSNESVGENETVNIGVDRTLSIGSNGVIDVGKNLTETIGQKMTLDVGDKADVGVRADLSVMVGKKTVLTTEDQITFVCGSSSITMKKDGTILISGADIKINASGKLVTKGQNITGN